MLNLAHGTEMNK